LTACLFVQPTFPQGLTAERHFVAQIAFVATIAVFKNNIWKEIVPRTGHPPTKPIEPTKPTDVLLY